jgi:hypothetical protein
MSTYKDIAELDNVIFLDLSNPTSTISAFNKVRVFSDPLDDTLSYIFLYGGFDNIDSYKNDIGNSGLIVSKLVSVIVKGKTSDGGSTGLELSQIAYMWELLGLSKIITNESPELFYFRKKDNTTYRAFTDWAYKEALKVSIDRKTDEILKEIQKIALAEASKKEKETEKEKKKGNPGDGKKGEEDGKKGEGDGKKLSQEEIAGINKLFAALSEAENIDGYVALRDNFIAITEDNLKAIQEEIDVKKYAIQFSNARASKSNNVTIKYKSLAGEDVEVAKNAETQDKLIIAIRDYINRIKQDQNLKNKKYYIPYSTKKYNPQITLS